MNDENTSNSNPIGLYKDPRSNTYVGALDTNQANAFVRVGFEIYEEGRDAAMKSQEELDALSGKKTADADLPEGGESYTPSVANKKGK